MTKNDKRFVAAMLLGFAMLIAIIAVALARDPGPVVELCAINDTDFGPCPKPEPKFCLASGKGFVKCT